MSAQYFGAVTALQFDVSSSELFKEIVNDLDVAFRPYGLAQHGPNWCGDNIAIIGRDSLQLVLGWLPAKSDGEPSYMVLAAGHATDGGNLLVTRETCEFVRDVLVGHLASYLTFDTVFRADATQPVDANLVTIVAEILDRDCAATLPDSLPDFDDHPQMFKEAGTREILPPSTALEPARYPAFQELNDVANDNWKTDVSSEEEASLPKRLTICALGATILIHTPPVGATLLIYTALRGFSSSQQQPGPIAA
ncbi:hypothetical protein [Marimonas lutisalis]|uniref:hypothetical protein n=1 Tax=Marimonas lutisalis TaxID=2545756 RepID=UPI0010F7C02F|nr:hypothetical protein [Marimonas lutisalis]